MLTKPKKMDKELFRTLTLRAPAVLLMALQFYLSSRSTLPGAPFFPHMDKLAHFVYFGAIAACWRLWFSGGKKRWPFFLCVLFTSLYGIIDEAHQYFVPGRSCDIFDWLADTMGAAAGSAAGFLLCRTLPGTRRAKH